MQTFRILPVIVTAALCASVFSSRADDTPEQAAARAALMEKLGQSDNTPMVTNSPSVPAEQAVVPAPPTTNAPDEPTIAPPPAPVPPPESVPAPAPMTTTEQPVPAPAPLPPLPAVSTNNLTVPPVEQASVPLPPGSSTNVTQYPVNPAMPQPADTSNTAGTSTNWSTPVAPVQETEQPMPSPPAPITANQQQQLQDLLSRYMANQITPAEYQAERAKILGGQ
jgi:hypothetical protein